MRRGACPHRIVPSCCPWRTADTNPQPRRTALTTTGHTSVSAEYSPAFTLCRFLSQTTTGRNHLLPARAKACHSPDEVQSGDDGVVRSGSRRESLETERDEIRREDGAMVICVLNMCTVTSLTCMLDVKSYELTMLPPPYFKGPALVP